MEFRRPLKSSPELEETIDAFRKDVSFNQADRILHDDMLKAIAFIRNTPIG
jgi:histidine ammonia-lyase